MVFFALAVRLVDRETLGFSQLIEPHKTSVDNLVDYPQAHDSDSLVDGPFTKLQQKLCRTKTSDSMR